ASRSTVSQEAVQEFQVVTNSFAPEFGRSAGGVVNVVTKSGTNEFHGNMFGFLRHRSFQARNAFAPIEDPPFTRTQYGFTLGGPFAQLGIGYAYLASGGGSTALNGFNPLIATGAPFTPGAIIGSRFFLTGAPVPLSTVNSLGQPIAFRALRNLQPIFPITDRTTFNSFRLDHLITSQHQFSFRFGYNPSTITGI